MSIFLNFTFLFNLNNKARKKIYTPCFSIDFSLCLQIYRAGDILRVFQALFEPFFRAFSGLSPYQILFLFRQQIGVFLFAGFLFFHIPFIAP
jgi:hypothetical protein